MRSLTTLVWWSRMFVHFCADDMSVCYVPVVALSYVICWSLISKKKKLDIHPQSSAVSVRLQRLHLIFSFSFTPRHGWPISTIFPVNKDLEDFVTSWGSSGFLLSALKGDRKQEKSLPTSICQAQGRFLGEGWPPRTPLQPPGTGWGSEEAGNWCGRWV